MVQLFAKCQFIVPGVLETSYRLCIQGGLWRKGNILGGDSIGHGKTKVHVDMCLTLIGYWEGAVWMYSYKGIVNNVNKYSYSLLLVF
jgi:hypothetical protein